MKRLLVLMTVCAVTLSLAACGSAPSSAPAGEETGEKEQQASVANPWMDTTEDEAFAEVPFLFTAPEGAENVTWRRMENGDYPMIELDFTLGMYDFTARAQYGASEDEDISGMYHEWTDSKDVTLANWGMGNMPATIKSGADDDAVAFLCSWYDIEMGEAYTLATTTQDDSELDMQAVAEALYDETKTPGYNMPDEEDESQTSESETSESDASGTADYSVAVSPDVADAATVEAYAKEAKEAVLNEDVDWIVKNARYPFYLVGQEIPDADALKEALLADDSPIRSEAFKEKVSEVETEDLFANYQGVMLGDGEIWFGESGEGDTEGLFIFTINGV